MLLIERENEILSLVNKRGAVSVRELAELCDVAEVTIRRDLKKLESLNLLRRTYGGAVQIGVATENSARLTVPDKSADVPDALILAPVQNRAVHTLRERALRSRIPLIAESAPQDGAIYLGPNNFDASVALGVWAGEYVRDHLGGNACVLDIVLQLPNTRARSAGFSKGLRSVLGDAAQIVTVDGHGLYNEAYQVAKDALRVHPEINVIFGINDDSVLGGLQAYLDLDRDSERLLAVNVGGEGKTLFDVLHRGGPLKACVALFPEVVGRLAIDAALRLWAGQDIGTAIVTPSTLLTADNLTDYYTPTGQTWMLNPEAVERLEQTRWTSPLPRFSNKRISFLIHYRTHEWYQNVARAMRARADEVDIDLLVEDVNEDLKAEINELRRLIGKMAASYVNDGDTIILDTGTATTSMAQFLDERRNLTVITNSNAIFQRLQRNPAINLILTGGEFHRDSQSFVGHGAQLLLKEIRADKVFLVAGGVSASFGVSCKNSEEAEVRRSMINSAREVVLLADHTLLGHESRVRVTDLEQIDTVITDAGAPSDYRLEFNQRGIKVMIAGQMGRS